MHILGLSVDAKIYHTNVSPGIDDGMTLTMMTDHCGRLMLSFTKQSWKQLKDGIEECENALGTQR